VQSQTPKKTTEKSQPVYWSTILLAVSLVLGLFGAIFLSLPYIGLAVVLGIAATTFAVLSLRE
jgi:hypothetical protein